MQESLGHDDLSEVLEEIASWLLAAYGARLAGLSLSLQGHYGPITECYGVVPITLARGLQPDGTEETRETLPSRELCGHADALLTRLAPGIRCLRDPGRDVREIASSRFLKAGDVSAHRKVELLRKYGRLSAVTHRSQP